MFQSWGPEQVHNSRSNPTQSEYIRDSHRVRDRSCGSSPRQREKRRSRSRSRSRERRHRRSPDRRRRASGEPKDCHRKRESRGRHRQHRSRSRSSSRRHKSNRKIVAPLDMRDASSSSSSRRLETSSERRDIVRRRSRGRAIESPVEGDVSDEVDISCNAGLDEAEEEDLLSETMRWIRCSPAELYYRRDEKNPGLVTGTEKLRALQEKFRHELVERAARAKSAQEPYNPPPRKSRLCNPKKHSGWFHLQGEKALHLACHTRKIMLKNLCTCIASHCIVNIFF